jgi:DNA-binding NarL/FixJ family response regulator
MKKKTLGSAIAPSRRAACPSRHPAAKRRRVSVRKKISVLLADDSSLVRQRLHLLLETDGYCEVVGQALNGREAVKLAQTLQPDVILMDLAMPVLNGLEATRQILAADPAAKVLFVSVHNDNEYIDGFTAVGAMGFVEKLAAAKVLTNAVRAVAKGKLFFSPAIARRMAGANA